MKPGRIAAWTIAAMAVPALAACGGSSSSVSSSSVSSSGGSASPGTSAPSQSQTVGQADAPGPTAGSGGLTPPGTHLGFGRDATVGWVPPSAAGGTSAHKGIKLQDTVESIQKCTIPYF